MGCSSMGANATTKTVEEKVNRIVNDEHFGFNNQWGWDLNEIIDVLGSDYGSVESYLNGFDVKIFHVGGKDVEVDFLDGYAQSVELLN